MTTAEASKLWGISTGRVVEYCNQGRIPGAKKIALPGWAQSRWFIPDDARRPIVKHGRPRLYGDYEPIQSLPESAEAEYVFDDDVELPDPTGCPPVRYVWENQDQPIRLIARALKVTPERVSALYDRAMAAFL